MSAEPSQHLPLASLLSTARQQQSLSLSAVAREMQRAAQAEGIHCGATRQTILGYERGRIPHPDALRWLAVALGLSIDTLATAAQKQRTYRQQLKVLVATELIEAAHDPDGATLDEDMERRELLAFLSRAAKAGLLSSGLRHLPTVTPLWPISDQTVEAVETIFNGYRQLWLTTPAQNLVDPVLAHLQFVSQSYASATSTRDQSKLAGVASQTALLAASLAEDMWQVDLAGQHYDTALTYARRSHHDLLQAHVVGSMSYWATRTGNGTEAVKLAGQAVALLPRDASPTARAWIALREAVAHATVHNQPAALAALDRAERALEEGEGEPDWPWDAALTQGKIDRYRGFAAVSLNLPEIALSALADGLQAVGPAPTKSRAYALSKLAEAHVQAGNVDEACERSIEALANALELADTWSMMAIREVRIQLQPVRTSQAVKQLDERLLSSLLSLPQPPQA